MKSISFILLLTFFAFRGWAQSGCTDPQAQNYNADATTNDGSCTYAATSASLTNPKRLPATINESSGLIFTDNKLWTINDSGGAAAIYRISESDGTILQVVYIAGATNVDWEAITADENYIYIGDFGNNANGSRSNLRIYRISKYAIGTSYESTVPADVINFSYQDQVITGPTEPNNTDFDCEAFVVKNNKLHLFTKEWVSPYNTKHYILPATPGTHVAVPAEELAVNGLITDATISAKSNVIVLIGYTKDNLNLFMWLLHDYEGENFFSGNKRRFSLGSSLQGQIEGVALTSNGNGYISSERISRTFLTVDPYLYSFSVADYVSNPVDPTPLPVELTYFDVAYTSKGVSLSWRTATEVNSKAFYIERSTDNNSFQEIGQLKAAGNSSIPVDYHFKDASSLVGTNYYRLKQIDQDGQFSYSPVKQIDAPRLDLKVSPVPASKGQMLHIELRTSEQNAAAKITFTGTDGTVHFLKVVENAASLSEQLRVDYLKRGIYVLRVTDSFSTYSVKVVLD